MTITAIVGTQWGDEGKGRIIDWLAQEAQLVIRFQGGDNAGHTVINNWGKFKLRLLPSGIFNPTCTCYLAAGMVINIPMLQAEYRELQKLNIPLATLSVSPRAHIVFPWHQILDKLEEQVKGGQKVGTTLRGIGPCYADKVKRIGIRVGDLFNEEHLISKLEQSFTYNRQLINTLSNSNKTEPPEFNLINILELCKEWKDFLTDKVQDEFELFDSKLNSNILLEGQLGIMRDLDWGFYPYCTSSTPTVAGACASVGLPPQKLGQIIGVAKAYTTVVGSGPFPTELQDETGILLREKGEEYGAATGRPRRCGWFDAVAVRFAVRINGLTSIMLTKLDVLSGMKKLKICLSWSADNKEYLYPPTAYSWKQLEPKYLEVNGWDEDISSCKSFVDLPLNAQNYVQTLEKLCACEVSYVSVGPAREQIFPRNS